MYVVASCFAGPGAPRRAPPVSRIGDVSGLEFFRAVLAEALSR